MTEADRQPESRGDSGPPSGRGYLVSRLEDIAPVECPCGQARRAFDVPEGVATMHLTEIARDARTHYHKRLTEIYYILEGEGHLELDGERVPVAPGVAVLIHPLTRHRAIGKLRVLLVSVPRFDPADEWFDGDVA